MKKALFFVAILMTLSANALDLDKVKADSIQQAKLTLNTQLTNSPYYTKLLYRYLTENNQDVKLDIKNIKENTSDKMVEMALSQDVNKQTQKNLEEIKKQDIAKNNKLSPLTQYTDAVLNPKPGQLPPIIDDNILIMPQLPQKSTDLGQKKLNINPDAFF